MGGAGGEAVGKMMRKAAIVAAASFAAAGSCALLKAGGAPPNIESLMPFAMSAGMALGPFYGFLNALLARAMFDGYQSWVGWWTIGTSISYGLVGLAAGLAARLRKQWSRAQLALLSGALTILYDVVTMLAFGVPFGIPVQVLVAGQIPFTIAHLAGNVTLCFAFAPFLLKSLNGYVEGIDATRGAAKPAAWAPLQSAQKED
ncbi:MAG: ECF transporter S component [Candidatus ainarchaeum sp.]|nr:ECF transporter S component [Candidatus ainarchaeum sp.]